MQFIWDTEIRPHRHPRNSFPATLITIMTSSYRQTAHRTTLFPLHHVRPPMYPMGHQLAHFANWWPMGDEISPMCWQQMGDISSSPSARITSAILLAANGVHTTNTPTITFFACFPFIYSRSARGKKTFLYPHCSPPTYCLLLKTSFHEVVDAPDATAHALPPCYPTSVRSPVAISDGDSDTSRQTQRTAVVPQNQLPNGLSSVSTKAVTGTVKGEANGRLWIRPLALPGRRAVR